MTSQGSEAYTNDISDMTDPPDVNPELSEIIKFYSGSHVLITGATGFMGKLLVERLLRSCPGISKLYLIVRAKKGKTAVERFKENFEDAIYDRLRKERPDFGSQVIMLEGDTGSEGLALSPEDKELLLNTDVIFHAAATVRFDEKIRLATNINVRAAKQLLLFARDMPNLKAFVHVSTAYSHCVLKCIDEKHYQPPMDGDTLLTLLDLLDDEKLDKMTPILIGKWPNTYAFTKAIAEDTVLRYSNGIPTCIVRPSIIVSTAKEPIPGWTNNLYGATGVVVGTGIGLLRTLHCIPENIADIIPADYVISNVIASAWETAKSHKASPSIANSDSDSNMPDEERVPIYNSVSSCQNPISWGTFMHLNECYGIDTPSIKVLWYYSFRLTRYAFLNNFYLLFLHLVPAAIVDSLAYVTGRKPMLMDAYRKIHKFGSVISYFSTQEWRFHNNNVMKLWKKLNPTDQQIFEFNMANLDWHDYFYYHIRGLRLYILNDPLDTLEAAHKKYNKLKIAHFTLLTVLTLLLLWGALAFFNFFWSFCPLAH